MQCTGAAHSVARLWRVPDDSQDYPYALQAIRQRQWQIATCSSHIETRVLGFSLCDGWHTVAAVPEFFNPNPAIRHVPVHVPLLQRVFFTFFLILSSNLFALPNCRFPRRSTASVIRALLKTTDAEISNGKSDISLHCCDFHS